ncbi:FGGY carbohydrate kinase domain-containing protein [Papilio xuthus]|uniref:FGGY carbohydrate kinase domain-containing protein n=1 Tax=Papilio xuthus TaxID=66420 RepID=A0A194QHT6_PAPXU|nr:FGGY carbohydrate kinase domain-containing protein [Papilio xuthus]
MNTQSFFIGVDVGSGSARAALVDQDGHILRTSVKELRIWKPQPDFYEQSSNDIWSCCEFVIKEVIRNVNPEDIKGIGFDATCSLVAMDRNGNPLAVSNSHNNEQNVILWMDDRAQTEAELINKTDYLTWKATGSESRSLCSLVCKWNYECSIDGKKGWNQDFLQNIGLDDLAAFDFKKIGSKVLMPGEKCGGLKNDVARSLGLIPGTPVATSIIDAHAGGLGMIGTNGEGIAKEMSSRLSLICGTSTCHMAVNKKPVLVPGIWGPYFSAMVPNLWLNEAGQSASGMLLDYVISSHPAGIQLLNKYTTGEVRTHLRQLLSKMTKEKGLSDVSLLSKDFHIWPDYHGNRSPLADPSMKGMICGLTINNSEENLALLYLATLQALSYGTRHIIEALVEAGYEPFKSLLICGGLSKDPLFVQIQADVVALPVLKPYESESVLLGSAILGACASQYFNNVQVAIETMGGKADVVPPNLNTKSFHDKKYKVFLKMYEDQLKYRAIMN